MKILVGESPEASLDRWANVFDAALNNQEFRPYHGVGFESMTQFGEVFTPKRWELVAALKASGPLTIYALAKHLGRHYRNVHKDVTALINWLVIEKNDDGKVYVPWDEISVRCPLMQQAA